jgi:hypothetical protein
LDFQFLPRFRDSKENVPLKRSFVYNFKCFLFSLCCGGPGRFYLIYTANFEFFYQTFVYHFKYFLLESYRFAAEEGRFYLIKFFIKLKKTFSVKKAIEKMAFSENHGTRIFDKILSSEGLAHIAENIFDQLDGEIFANCELVCKSWRHFIVNNGAKLWKRRYLQRLARPGTDAHRLIKSNPKLFQFDQADQGTFHILYIF